MMGDAMFSRVSSAYSLILPVYVYLEKVSRCFQYYQCSLETVIVDYSQSCLKIEKKC
jgi:hypothetical protein